MENIVNPVTPSELSKALDDLVTESLGIPLADDDVTVSRFAAKAGCTWDTARSKVKELEAAGRLEYIGKRRAPSGKPQDAWRIKK
jgi:predicted ArsR family transcriptional regulator